MVSNLEPTIKHICQRNLSGEFLFNKERHRTIRPVYLTNLPEMCVFFLGKSVIK